MKWVHELADILTKKTFLTSVDKGYFVTLLNWLVAVDNTNIDIKDIIVVSYDKTTCDILKQRKYLQFMLKWKNYSFYSCMGKFFCIFLGCGLL